MSVESIGFGLLLLGIGKLQGPWISQPNVLLGLPNLNVDPQTSERFGRVVSFVGAGIYEECIFRLMIYTILLYILDCGNLAQFVTIPIAIVLSAVIFSAAHHMGPFGEPYNPHLFLFRFQAGVFFALLYQLRGIGIAVGTHAFYDVLVGSALV
jgi:membrane protease YdiL (CAAX protease family)